MFRVPWITPSIGVCGGGQPAEPFSFVFSVISTQIISGLLSTAEGETVTFDWGNSTTTDYSGTNQSWSKNYGSSGNRTVTVTGPAEALTLFTLTETGANISFSPGDLPYGIEIVRIAGANTITGDIGQLPKSCKEFDIQGTGTTSLYGNTNDLGATSQLIGIYVTRANTVTGDIGLLPPGIEWIRFSSNNTLYGDIGETPIGLIYCKLDGKNTESDYTTKTWAANMDQIYSKPVSPGGLSSSEIDQLLIDLSETTFDPALAKKVTLIGTNAARTSASDSAVAALVAAGVTVLTN